MYHVPTHSLYDNLSHSLQFRKLSTNSPPSQLTWILHLERETLEANEILGARETLAVMQPLLVQALLESHLPEWPPTDSTSAETIATMRRERSDASDAERRDAHPRKTVKDVARAVGSQKDTRRAIDLETTAVTSLTTA
jgi:hypothetical protein